MRSHDSGWSKYYPSQSNTYIHNIYTCSYKCFKKEKTQAYKLRIKGNKYDFWDEKKIWKILLSLFRGLEKTTSLIWKPPSKNWIKINTDAKFDNGNAQTALVVRNQGSIIFVSSKKHQYSNPRNAKSQALLEACQIINTIKLQNVIFEADCLNAIKFITNLQSQIHWSAKNYIEEITKFWSLWPKWRSKLCSRSTNFAAHNLAKWADVVSWDGPIPLNLLPCSLFLW